MKPTAAPPYFPYTTHRTMAEVMRDEDVQAFSRRPRSARGMSMTEWLEQRGDADVEPSNKKIGTPRIRYGR
jgi:hypothetical protein